MDLKMDTSDKILIVAPHPDDESIGAGGLMLKFGNRVQTDVLVLTDGSKGHRDHSDIDEGELANIRKEEIKSALDFAGINTLFCLDIPDRELAKNSKTVKKFDISPYTKIFVPNRYEQHIDHRVVYKFFHSMIKKQHSSADLYEYEVWQPLREANVILDISDVIVKKQKLVTFYESQLECHNYVNMCTGLNMYRGVKNNIAYAEAYYLEPKFNNIKQCYSKLLNIFVALRHILRGK